MVNVDRVDQEGQEDLKVNVEKMEDVEKMVNVDHVDQEVQEGQEVLKVNQEKMEDVEKTVNVDQ